MLAIKDERDAFRIDRAVSRFGNALKHELESVTGKKEAEIAAKRMRVLQRWVPETSASNVKPATGFKDPAASVRKG